MTKEQIEQMVNAFLCWKLPQTFNPDCYISFAPKPDYRGNPPTWPVGTNLFSYTEAKAMVEHMLAALSPAPTVPEGWFPMETLVHQHVSDSPLTVDGKVVPATYTSDPVILTNGKRVWVERSVIMGGAMSSSANKFTAYPSGDKPTHWQPLPAPPAPEAGR